VVEDLAIGGQAGTSSRIENYMGFPTGISGADLVWRGEVQAMKFGTRFAVPLRATGIAQREEGGFCLTFDDGQSVCAGAVVVATGVEYRRLPLPRLEDFEGNGVYYAATENEARYCRAGAAVVIGGGNSAGQAAMHLSRSASHVHVVVRGQGLAATMSSYLMQRLEADPAITIHYQSEVTALAGNNRLDAVTITSRQNGTQQSIPCRALFIMIGAAPNTDWLGGLAQLDAKGFICTGPDCGRDHSPYETSCAGLFAVGDVRATSVKRVASAVGEGSVVISQVYAHVRSDQG
jgi:thioredoxin reductase (NADPH)